MFEGRKQSLLRGTLCSYVLGFALLIQSPSLSASIIESQLGLYVLTQSAAGRALAESLSRQSLGVVHNETTAQQAIELLLKRSPRSIIDALESELQAFHEQSKALLNPSSLDHVGFLRWSARSEQGPFRMSSSVELILDQEIHRFFATSNVLRSEFTRAGIYYPNISSARRNPFFSFASREMTAAQLRGTALKILQLSKSASPEIRWFAAQKKTGLNPTYTVHPDFEIFLLQADDAEKTQAALEYLFSTSRSLGFSQDFARAILKALAESPESDSRTIALLLTFTRGAVLPGNEFARIANETLTQISLRSGRGLPARGAPASGIFRTDVMDILLHESIRSIRQFSEREMLVTFENGHQAIFRPMRLEKGYAIDHRRPEHILFNGEVNAYEIAENWLGNAKAREKGLSRIEVPATAEVVLVHQGVSYGVGSLQHLRRGFVPLVDFMKSHPEAWVKLTHSMEWYEAIARLHVVDYLLGNSLRLGSRLGKDNFDHLMIHYESSERFTLSLVENARPRNAERSLKHEYFPPRDLLPRDLKSHILGLDTKAFRRTHADRMADSGIETFLHRLKIAQSHLMSAH